MNQWSCCFSTSLRVQSHWWWQHWARGCVYVDRWAGGQHGSGAWSVLLQWLWKYNLRDFNKHIACHQVDELSCEVCDKKMKNKKALSSHRRSAHSFKVCKHCNKNVPSTHIKRHEKSCIYILIGFFNEETYFWGNLPLNYISIFCLLLNEIFYEGTYFWGAPPLNYISIFGVFTE